MRRIQLSTKAILEFEESWAWYEEQQEGLGDKFEIQLLTKLTEIQKNPNRYPNKEKKYREAILKKYPFIIIYYFNEEEIIVTSIFHTSRNPKRKYI